MDWLTIIKTALYFVIALVTTGAVPTVIALFKAHSKKKKADTAVAEAIDAKEKAEALAAKEQADADLRKYAEQLIVTAEAAYAGMDKLMKTQSNSAGTVKKDTAFIKLQAYALQKGYDFDIEKWSQVLDDIVALTKCVNAK